MEYNSPSNVTDRARPTEESLIRVPAVAGYFYPADPDALAGMVAGFLSEGPGAGDAPGVAMLAPHAGLIYSGAVAGAAYLRVRIPERVILLGPNHTGLGPPLSVWEGGEWAMPGGAVPVEEELRAALRRQYPDLAPDRAAHLREHCLEVQIPFLRARNPRVAVVPVVIGTSRLEVLRGLGEAVARAIRAAGRPVLIVVSSDMTHYEPAEAARRRDALALEAMERLDPEALHRVVREQGITMCGAGPAVAGLFAARELGATTGRVIRYGHSGEVTGDHGSVVGYAGMVFS